MGHETDWTIIDLVADFRAPTPTAAAERAVPVRADLHITVTQLRLARRDLAAAAWSGARRHRFAGLARGLPRRADILGLPRQRFDSAEREAGRALHANALRIASPSRAPARGSGRISWRARGAGGATG